MLETLKPKIITDKEAGQRYHHLVALGRKKFEGTALLNDSSQITDADIAALVEFHRESSPTTPKSPWRQAQEFRSRDEGQIVDSSTYGNWEAIGGPLEHINLASDAAKIITELIKKHARVLQENDPLWLHKAILEIQQVEPLHAVAAALLHDEGRGVTHLFYTNEVIGNALLRRIGIREDLRDVLPNEQLMLTPPDEDFNEALQQLSAEAVIIRLADEFGKRFPRTNRIYQPSDYDAWDRDTWAIGYISRPLSGRPSDAWMRTQMQLHVDNVPRYFAALDNWVRTCTTLTLQELCEKLSERLNPTLQQLQ